MHFYFQPEWYKWNINVVQCSDFLIMPGSFSYNCCVLIYDLVGMHTLVTELKLTCIFVPPEKHKWNIQYNDFLVYFSIFSYSIVKIFFTEMKKLKTFNNLFKIFMKTLENLDSLKIKGLQWSSYKNFLKISKKLKTILDLFHQRWKISSSKNTPRCYSDRE